MTRGVEEALCLHYNKGQPTITDLRELKALPGTRPPDSLVYDVLSVSAPTEFQDYHLWINYVVHSLLFHGNLVDAKNMCLHALVHCFESTVKWFLSHIHLHVYF